MTTTKEEIISPEQEQEAYSVEELRQQFNVFDPNGTGFIEKEELQEALKTLGYQMSDDGFDNLLQIVGSTDDRLNFDEFIAWNRELYKEEMKQEFDSIDSDHSGWISKSELRAYSKTMKYNLTEEQIEDFLYQADANQNDKVGLDEYISAMAAAQTGKAYFILNGEMYLAKLKADFQAMDADGNGVVTKEDLRQKAKDIEYYITEEELESTIQSMDENEDGKITLEEFVAATIKIKKWPAQLILRVLLVTFRRLYHKVDKSDDRVGLVIDDSFGAAIGGFHVSPAASGSRILQQRVVIGTN